jgi:hypothetical protein
VGFLRNPSREIEERDRGKRTDRILKKKALAFSLVAMSALGTVFKGQSGIEGSLLLDGFLMGCLALGLFFWIGSKRMEWRDRREEVKDEK